MPLFDFSPLCVIKCVLKSPVWIYAKSHWLHLLGLTPVSLLFPDLCNLEFSTFSSIITEYQKKWREGSSLDLNPFEVSWLLMSFVCLLFKGVLRQHFYESKSAILINLTNLSYIICHIRNEICHIKRWNLSYKKMKFLMRLRHPTKKTLKNMKVIWETPSDSTPWNCWLSSQSCFFLLNPGGRACNIW